MFFIKPSYHFSHIYVCLLNLLTEKVLSYNTSPSASVVFPHIFDLTELNYIFMINNKCLALHIHIHRRTQI